MMYITVHHYKRYITAAHPMTSHAAGGATHVKSRDLRTHTGLDSEKSTDSAKYLVVPAADATWTGNVRPCAAM